MKWWNDLWLNEGFASYIEYKGTDFAEPSWDYQTEFLVKDLQPVIKLDSLTSSHPIIQEVNNPDQITELFDSISYGKGSSVLRMLEATIGSNAFKNGIRSYMKKYQYSNAETNDFWNSLSEFVTDVSNTL
jgi:glutamyl aminopeptidase